jgi:hypothetical protein
MKATEIMHILFDKADNTLDNIPEKDRRLYGIAGSLVEAIASKDSRTDRKGCHGGRAFRVA